MTLNKRIQDDMRMSEAVMKKASPIIRQMFENYNINILQVEYKNEEVCNHLDKTCGIDYFVVHTTTGLTHGVAWRAQKVHDTPYDTFTVRKSRKSGAPTEYEKRKRAIEKNGIYPYYVMQCYVDEVTGDILSMALTTTKDIIDFIENKSPQVKTTGSDKIGQAEFYVIPWLDMLFCGYNIILYEKKE